MPPLRPEGRATLDRPGFRYVQAQRPTLQSFTLKQSLQIGVSIYGRRMVLHQATGVRSRTVNAVLVTAEHTEQGQL
jgi:hypothetical protein